MSDEPSEAGFDAETWKLAEHPREETQRAHPSGSSSSDRLAVCAVGMQKHSPVG